MSTYVTEEVCVIVVTPKVGEKGITVYSGYSFL